MSAYPSSRSSLTELQLENASISMRDKALIKRHITKQHNSNFRAGYVPVHESSLHKTGLRGRKTYIFWMLVSVLFLLALANLFLTFTIVGVLRLGQGLESLEVVPYEDVLKFYGDTDLDQLYKRDGKLEGFVDDPVQMEGEEGPIRLQVYSGKNPHINVTEKNISVANVDIFAIQDPYTGEPVFSTRYPNFGLPHGVARLDISVARVRRVTSPSNASLSLKSESFTHLRGNEGTHLEGREIVWTGDQDVYLKSMNGSIVLTGSSGVVLDVKTIPLGLGSGTGSDVTHAKQYKICVCMPNGKLFRVPVQHHRRGIRVNCNAIDLSQGNNPCM